MESKSHLVDSIRAEVKSKEQIITYLALLNTRGDKKREFVPPVPQPPDSPIDGLAQNP